jgi:hypothetical protein
MTTYTKSPTKTLKYGDTVIFTYKRATYRYSVAPDHLSTPHDSNRQIFKDVLGTESYQKIEKFAAGAYGYSDTVNQGAWPCSRDGDYPALTRLVRAIFARCRKMTKKEREAQAAAEKKEREARAAAEAKRADLLTTLPVPARNFVAYLDKHREAFGCQRRHVIATVGAILGVDLSAVV